MAHPFPKFLNTTFQPQGASNKKKRIIFHIDFDSFFASVEQQYQPQFRNKPLGVTATNGRTCIIAASREAKRMGIVGGSRTFDAFRLCPYLQLTPAHFSRYFEISKTFISICKDYSPLVEVFSLDELFMDVTDTVQFFGGPEKLIYTIKKRIRQQIGAYITVSVGMSHNKLLAKLASGLKKPDGVCVINDSNFSQIYDSIPLTEICGIGERIYRRLNMMGIRTLTQLGKTPLHLLIAEFGNIQGQILKNMGLGIDYSDVIPYTQEPEVKSVGRNYCLARNEYDRRKVLQHLYELCEELGKKLRKLQKKARTLGYGLIGMDDLYGRETYSDYFDNGRDIFRRMQQLIEMHGPFEKREGYTRQIRVWVANLYDTASTPRSLFEPGLDNPRLLQAVDHLNAKFGSHTIRNGYLLNAPKLKTVPNGFMGDRYERIKLARTTR